jgi:O-antigen ligase
MKLLLSKISIEKILITLFMGAYLIPNFVSTDRVGNQWLYLSVITLLSLIYIASFKDLIKKIKGLFQKKAIVSYALFLIWALFSIGYSSNKVESVVTFNQFLVVFFCFIFFQILSKNISDGHKFILNLLFVLLIIETFLSLSPIISDIENDSLVFRSMKYSGAAANINITSFSLVYKLPLLLFFFEKFSKPAIKFFLSLLLFLIIFVVSILGTRGAFIGIGISILTLFYYLIVSEHTLSYKIKQLCWTLLPVLIAIIINISFLGKKDNDIITRAATININTNDGSVNQRLRYYKHCLTQFYETPLTGVGIGNWKLYSIDYDKKDINGFIVPYHAHNDFLQILAELGIFGFIFYLSFLFYSTKKLFKNEFFESNFNIFLIGSIAVYFLDSSLNFPISRPISQLFFIALLTIISANEKKVIS